MCECFSVRTCVCLFYGWVRGCVGGCCARNKDMCTSAHRAHNGGDMRAIAKFKTTFSCRACVLHHFGVSDGDETWVCSWGYPSGFTAFPVEAKKKCAGEGCACDGSQCMLAPPVRLLAAARTMLWAKLVKHDRGKHRRAGAEAYHSCRHLVQLCRCLQRSCIVSHTGSRAAASEPM